MIADSAKHPVEVKDGTNASEENTSSKGESSSASQNLQQFM